MKTAIIIGHSANSQGAYNKTHNVTEFEFNKRVAGRVKELGCDSIELVYRISGYSRLPKLVNDTNANLAVSLHCNAFNKIASGTETLSSGSKGSNKMANIIQPKMVECFELADRGIKFRDAHERGGLILHETDMPIVLLEPFFIDNDSDFELGLSKVDEYAQLIIDSINEYYKG